MPRIHTDAGKWQQISLKKSSCCGGAAHPRSVNAGLVTGPVGELSKEVFAGAFDPDEVFVDLGGRDNGAFHGPDDGCEQNREYPDEDAGSAAEAHGPGNDEGSTQENG